MKVGNGLESTTLRNCYNIGTVSGSYFSGGIVSAISSDGDPSRFLGTVTDCYYLEGTTTDSNATAKTSNELKSLVSTLGTAWKSDTNNINNGYPILSWQ